MILELLIAGQMSLLTKVNKIEEEPKKLSIISRAIMHGGNASDLASTIYALDKDNVKEANPVIGSDPSALKLGLIKAGTSIGTDILLSKLAKSHPKIANGMAKGLGIGLMLVAAHNLNQTR